MLKLRFLVFPNANLLDIAGPLQCFMSASQYAERLGKRSGPSYSVELVSLKGGAVRTSADATLETQPARPEDVDTFLISGGYGVDQARAHGDLIEYVRAQAARSRRTGSICTGAFILAQAGLLDGRQATTHWNWRQALAKEFPRIILAPDAVFVEDAPIWTSAGVLAGVDMALAMIEQDIGHGMASYTARALVAPQRRAPGAPQIGAQLQAQELELGRIRELMEWIAENPRADLSTSALAERACLSVRSLHRHFAHQTGVTPAAFVEDARIEAASRALTGTDMPLERVRAASGFRSLSAMKRAFARKYGVSPTQYRRGFAGASRP